EGPPIHLPYRTASPVTVFRRKIDAKYSLTNKNSPPILPNTKDNILSIQSIIFGEGAYIFQNSKSDYRGRNYVSYLGGVGIQRTERLFVSVLAKGSSPRSEGADAQAEGRLKVNHMHSRRLSWEIYGLTDFSDASPDFGGGLILVYQF
ncbi:MAG: hypothetical protein M0P74_18255, partial [Syntrophales bacterium]|nr:hypothetical protein [Syntrophales bacterium]